MTGTMTWAAMDVHARSTYAASLDVVTGELCRQRFDTGAVEPVVGWLAGLPGPVCCCYEAGPTGFGLYRAAVAAGIECQVIAPSKTPRPSGDRNKSDRRDTDLLLRQLMAGALTAVAVPSVTCEAARDLARARAFTARCSSDHGWGWCPRASSPANPISMGRSPRPARSTRGGSWSRPPGITPARRGSGGRSTSARRGCPTMSCRSHDAPRAASTGSTVGCGSARSPAT